MPGRPRGRAAPRQPAGDDYPGYPGYGGHPDDGPHDDHADAPAPARNGRPGRNGHPGRNGSARPAPPPARRDDDPEPLYARDQTPLGYDGGDPDDPPDAPPLLTHGGGDDRGRRNGKPARGRNGVDRDGYDREGFDRSGYDREGFDRQGFDRDGFDREGFDREGFDEEGFDRDGFDLDGYDRDGYPADDLEEYDDTPGDGYDEYADDEDYDDDAYGVGDGPLAVPPPGSNGRPLGPADVEELDPSMTDALARVDLGSMQVPVPFGADMKLEGAEGGRPQAVHLMLPEGRIAVSALAAPRSSGLWPELCDEIEESLRGGGARVRTAQGDWGRELHARTENAASVFIGADGPRWMVYGVATAAMDTVEALDVELRRVMRGIIVVRGKLPYPPRTVLPLQRAEDRAEAENADKPRGASITVSVPAARPDGAAADGATTRTPAARNGAPTAGGAAAAGAPVNGAARNAPGAPDAAPVRNGAPAPPRNGAARPGRPAAGQAPAGPPPGPDRRPVPPPSRRPDVPDGPGPVERTAANGARRPVPPEPPRGRAGRPAAAPDGRPEPAATDRRGPEATGAVPAPQSAEEAGVLRPRGALAPGTPPAPAAERTGAQRPRRGEQAGAAPARTPEDTGRAGRTRVPGPGDAPGDRPERYADRPDDTGARRSRHGGTGGTRARRDAGAPPPTRMPPPVDAPAPGYAEETPVTGTASVRRDDLLWTPESATDVDDRPAAAAGPGAPDERPARRDPAVTSLPSFGPDAPPGPSTRHAEPSPETAWTPPSGIPAAGPGRSELDDPWSGPRDDDEVTPRGGTRAVDPRDPWDTGVPSGPDRGAPPWRDPDPTPASRMAIEDIPLADVPLVEATLDSAPVVSRSAEPSEPSEPSGTSAPSAPSEDPGEPVVSERPLPPELPRRRPSGGRRRDASAAEGRGARRRAPEEDVLSDWMSAEIAHRPAGRHATPGHRDRPSAGEVSGRRAADPAASGDALFRPSDDEREGGRRGRRADDRPERRRARGRAGSDGHRAAADDDPMTLFRAPDDSGRHRR